MTVTPWSLDGIVFNSGSLDADGIEWLITDDSEPVSSPAPTSQYQPRFQRHGSYRIPGYRDRTTDTFVIRGYARRDDEAAKARAELRVLALCQDTALLYPLVWYSEVGPLVKNVTVDGEILIKPVVSQNPGFEASVQLTAPDPRRYALEWQEYTTGIPQNAVTGLDFQSTDLLSNPFFTTATTGWAGRNSATVAQGSDTTRTYASVTSTQASTNSGIVTSAAVTGLSAGTTYDFSAQIWSATRTAYNLVVQWQTSGGVNLTATTVAVSGLPTSAWVPVSGRHLAPATAAQALVYVESATPMTIGQSFRVTGLSLSTGGLDFDNSGQGLDFGQAATQGSLILSNSGTAPATPVMTLYGPLTTPVLTTASGSIKYNGTIAGAEFVVLDPADPSVLLGGITSRGYLANPAQWDAFVVQPGQSITIGLSHSGASTDGGYVVIRFRPAWW